MYAISSYIFNYIQFHGIPQSIYIVSNHFHRYHLSAIPRFLTQPIFPRISRIRTSTQSVAQFSMQPSLRFRAMMTSFLPILAMELTFLCSSVAGYHDDASNDDDAVVAAGKPATEQAVSCYLPPINTASFKPNRINRTFIISCSALNPAKQAA